MSDEIKVQAKIKKTKLIIALAAVVIAVLTIVAVVLIGSNNANAKKVKEQLSLGDKYLSELNYEQAIAAYELAIEIDPKCEEAYIGLAEVYEEMGEFDKAIVVLEETKAVVGDDDSLKRVEEKMRVIENKKQEWTRPETMATPVPIGTPKAEAQKTVNVSCFIPWSEAGLEDHIMDWKDSNLEVAMREKTGITEGDIMLSDVWAMQRLELNNKSISDISALSELTNLEVLCLDFNNISDISALAKLTKLKQLYMNFNEICDIDSLRRMNWRLRLTRRVRMHISV